MIPAAPAARGDVVVIEIGVVTEMLNARWVLCWGVPLSVTLTIKFATDTVVGVPLIVAPESVRPAGKAPEARDHV